MPSIAANSSRSMRGIFPDDKTTLVYRFSFVNFGEMGGVGFDQEELFGHGWCVSMVWGSLKRICWRVSLKLRRLDVVVVLDLFFSVAFFVQNGACQRWKFFEVVVLSVIRFLKKWRRKKRKWFLLIILHEFVWKKDVIISSVLFLLLKLIQRVNLCR